MCEADYVTDIGQELADEYEYEKSYNNKEEIPKGQIRKAKKNYICCICGKQIQIGDKYERVNINYVGIFHKCKNCIGKE